MRDILILGSLVFYESFNMNILYAIIPFIKYDMDENFINFIVTGTFLLGQIIGYFFWNFVGKNTSILKIIFYQLLLCILWNMLFVFSFNLIMLSVSRFLFGTSCTFISIAQKYLSDSYSKRDKINYIIFFSILWEMGKITGVLFGSMAYRHIFFNIYIQKDYQLIEVGIISLCATLICIMITFLISIFKLDVEIQYYDAEGSLQTVATQTNEPITTLPDNEDIYNYIPLSEILKDTKNNYLIISSALLSAISLVYADILKLILSLSFGEFALNYKQNIIEYFSIISSFASIICGSIIIYFYKKRTLKKINIIMILLFSTLCAFPFTFLININYFDKLIILIIYNSIIQILFNIANYHISENLKYINNSNKFGISYNLSKNISRIFNIIFNIILTIILTYTSKVIILKYIIDANTVFYVFGILLIFPYYFHRKYLNY